MNIELKHLKTVLAIHETGSVTAAADYLNMTQSALSHQLRYIKEQLGVDIFMPDTRPLKLSSEGLEIVAAAQRILPELRRLKSRFVDLKSGQTGRMFIAIECHACFEWLFPILNVFRDYHSNVDIDIKPGLAFNALPALAAGEVDLVISADPEDLPNIEFHELFSYKPVFVCAKEHPLAEKPFIEASDFAEQTVITYPVPLERLDLFSQLLIPANITPLLIRKIELTSIILLLVGANKGVSVLPDWVLRSTADTNQILQKQLTSRGMSRSLYAAVRTQDGHKPFVQTFLNLSYEALKYLPQK
ncbi:LysR family transcriptional regulator [Alphaproteobacteria bacterium]|nr:LysR family transcriptional regulator [Alphaproteobacteria bacterium]MDC0394718.1 LysR family transcriptional regulator [Alphaproteobacteria bacterium]MDC0461404.1 LysR family transcriptional regulator [Alphaproteobacteria bacterium]MDC3311625.1 LysR family transcriptional regulator [Alphaproteobacteria bacterium]